MNPTTNHQHSRPAPAGRRRVVITGLGAVTPLGHNVADTWAGIRSGRSGLGPFTLLDRGDHTTGGLCEVKEFDAGAALGRRTARRTDRCQHFGLLAAQEALTQAGLVIDDALREHMGIYIGTGVGGVTTLMETEAIRLAHGIRRISPFAITMIMPNGTAGMLAIEYGILGPANTFVTACASGNDAIGHALRAIRYGELDAAIAGGTESIMTAVSIGGFEQAKATSNRSSNTPSPFALDRDGLVIGEGAGMLILESLEHAQARGAHILAELVGYGQTSDAFHITAPSAGGIGAARAIRAALNDAGLQPEDVDYVNAHGTGTQLNDKFETMSLKHALGDHAYQVAISSTKSMTGHIMGATGAIECALAVMAIRDQLLPPTINYELPDPECDLDYVPNEARPAQVDVVLNNAFGFGGHNAVLALRRFDPEV
jgi:3-oxoacyl-[acyl-carrier-protein] synthase II